MHVADAPKLTDLLTALPMERVSAVLDGAPPDDHEYVHWDRLRHLAPPQGLSAEEWWLRIKLGRSGNFRFLPVSDQEGQPLRWSTPDQVLRLLHYMDQNCGGAIAMPEKVTADDQARQHYLVNSLMEEAIRSSQLEGATTARRVALELLRTGRPPRDRSERMILNNYRAIQYMRDEMAESPLSVDHVLALHRVLTEDTLDNPDAAGRFQTSSDERVAVYSNIDGSLIHTPPPADWLPGRMDALCRFANGEDDTELFVHPVVRAMLVHFWLAHDHPFEDGNGRTARALFYWSMKQQGYWLVEYLSISRILRKAPSQYARAFMYAETDEGDTTYFLIYQLKVMRRAMVEFHEYLKRKVREVQEVEKLVKSGSSFNHRQLGLISDAIRHGGRHYSFAAHAASHGVTVETARTDILGLAARGLLSRLPSGRRHTFMAPADLAERLRELD